MKNIFTAIVIMLLLQSGCVSPSRMVTYLVPTKPVYTLSPAPQKIIIVNSFDVKAKKFRDNKEELFIAIGNELLDSAAGRIHDKTGFITEAVYGYTSIAGNTDSMVHQLLQQKNATHAIIISSYDVYFNQTHVEVTKDAYTKSKNRKAFYDIVSMISFSFYGNDSLPKKIDMAWSRPHSSRTVVSGLLAAGPNVVVQKDDARSISLDNLQQYLNYYFPGQKYKTRTLMAEKGFERMIAAVDNKDYVTALAEAKILTTDASKYKAAMAFYDCAVFYEMKWQTAEALDNLRMSLASFPLQPAKDMLLEIQP